MQKNIRFIAVDDNPVDLLILKEYAAHYAFLQHLESVGNSEVGLAAIESIKPELVFLDIEMPGMSGLEILQKIKEHVPMVVFITSHPEFALEGFELSALDYILKPLTAERFKQTANRIEEYWQMKQKAAAYEVLIERETLTIKEGYNNIRLPVHEILYLEAMQDYTKVVTQKKNYLTLTTLTAFLEKLSVTDFIRVHRSYAVAMNKISELHPTKIICNGLEIPIGKTYKPIVSRLQL